MPVDVLTPILFLCMNSGVGCGPPSDSPSFSRDTVPLLPPSAAADEGTAVVRHVQQDDAPSTSEDRRFAPSGALELNPLPVGFGKFGGNIEISLASHQALVLSPAYFDFGNYFNGPEAEVGYRFYFFPHTLSGPFLGAGVMGAAFQYHTDPICGAGAEPCLRQDESTYLYGATAEMGWQWLLRSHLVLGVGAGLILQHAAPRKHELYDSDFTNIAELVLDSGIHPRGLFSVGYAF